MKHEDFKLLIGVMMLVGCLALGAAVIVSDVRAASSKERLEFEVDADGTAYLVSDAFKAGRLSLPVNYVEDMGDGLAVAEFLRGEADIVAFNVRDYVLGRTSADDVNPFAVDDDPEDCSKAAKKVCKLLNDEVETVTFNAIKRTCDFKCMRGITGTATVARP